MWSMIWSSFNLGLLHVEKNIIMKLQISLNKTK